MYLSFSFSSIFGTKMCMAYAITEVFNEMYEKKFYLEIMIYCSDLIRNESLQEEQIIAANKVIRLLYPSERTAKISEKQDVKLTFPGYTPSMIAASTILGYVKP